MDSILGTIKKVLGHPEPDDAFDVDIILHINSVFSTLNQLGVGPDDGFMIEDDTATWDAFLGTDKRKNHVKSYMYLRLRMLFDPPQTSYMQTAMEKQIAELEWRINTQREQEEWVDPVTGETLENELVLDGGTP